jgi:hypothetical protein
MKKGHRRGSQELRRFFSLRDDRRLVQAAARLSEEALRKVWDNPDDAEYDRLPSERSMR